MKFILVSPKNRTSYNFRGDLIKKIISMGYEVIVTGPNVDNIDKIESLGARFVEIPLKKNGLNPISDLGYGYKLFRLFKNEKPDMILSYTIKPVIYGSISAKLAGVRQINSMITGLGYLFTAKSTGVKLLRELVKLLYKLALGCSDTVIVQNPDDLKEIVELNLVKKEKCHVVNGSGVNMEKFSFISYPEKVSFFMLSRVLKSKGTREYLEACEIVKGKYPLVDFFYLGAHEEMKDSLDFDLFNNYKNKGIVQFSDETSDVRSHFGKASVFVLPSYREGTPRTVLEAMAMSRPIITTDTPGCRETVVEGQNGFLVPIKNVDKLVEKMIWFIENPDKVETMGINSKKICKAKFDIKIVNDSMVKYMKLKEETECS